VAALVVLVIFEGRPTGTPFIGEGVFVRAGRLIFGAVSERNRKPE
jgi:hypothetical protein